MPVTTSHGPVWNAMCGTVQRCPGPRSGVRGGLACDAMSQTARARAIGVMAALKPDEALAHGVRTSAATA